jgi:hypothetical protein
MLSVTRQPHWPVCLGFWGRSMNVSRFLGSMMWFLLGLVILTQAQTQSPLPPTNPPKDNDVEPELSRRPAVPRSTDQSAREIARPQKFDLTVPTGTPLRISLSDRVRIWREGTAVTGKVRDTVYAFDQPVIPAGSAVRGHVIRVAPVPKFRRAMGILNADFSPPHEYTLTFDSLTLGDGRSLPLTTTVVSSAGEVVHVVSDTAPARHENPAVHAAAGMKQTIKDDFHRATTEIKTPGRAHRLKQVMLAQLPVRRQYVEPGTTFDALLDSPLTFGSETRTVEQLSSVGTRLATASPLHARLTAEVSSATAHRGTPIEAVITEPVFNADHKLVLPVDSRLIGEVTQAKPAGRLHHNGQLRVVFEKIATPAGQGQEVQGSLSALEVARNANMKLDDEGGARVTDSKSRYLSTGLTIALAAAAAHPESDNGAPDGLADPATRTAAGGSGFKAVGAIVSLAAQSKAFSAVLGVYGASMSVYTHFLSRGRDVVLPKDTPVEIAVSERHKPVASKSR